ncbi:MAG: GNAT family N-acetyltransferase [Bacteroidota bacterium]
MLPIELRQAKVCDVDFLIEAIIEAEKSGSDKISYCTLFDLSEQELKAILRNILAEDIEGQQLCISGFAVVCVGDKAVATCCSWIEGQDGMSSSIITGSLLGEYIPDLNFKIGAEKNDLLKSIHIEREKGSLQIESVYTRPEFRGKGFIRKLIQYHCKNKSENQKGVDKIQIIVAESNTSAFTAYQKMGFSISNKVVGNSDLMKYLPSCSRLVLESKINLFI